MGRSGREGLNVDIAPVLIGFDHQMAVLASGFAGFHVDNVSAMKLRE